MCASLCLMSEHRHQHTDTLPRTGHTDLRLPPGTPCVSALRSTWIWASEVLMVGGDGVCVLGLGGGWRTPTCCTPPTHPAALGSCMRPPRLVKFGLSWRSCGFLESLVGAAGRAAPQGERLTGRGGFTSSVCPSRKHLNVLLTCYYGLSIEDRS